MCVYVMIKCSEIREYVNVPLIRYDFLIFPSTLNLGKKSGRLKANQANDATYR